MLPFSYITNVSMKAVFALFVLVAVLAFSSSASAQSIECQLCRFSVNFIEGYLAENATETQIIKYLDAICALSPGSFAAQCKSFVQQEVPALIQYIINTESPETACTQLGLCFTAAKENFRAKNPKKVTDNN